MKTVIITASLIATSTALGQDVVYEGGGIADWLDGTGELMRTDIEVTDTAGGFLRLEIFGFAHTWAGDLTIDLTNKDTGETVSLLNRPGSPESTFGDSADFDGSMTYTWEDGGFVYDADIYDTFVDSTVTYGALSGAMGDLTAGTWSLQMTDNGGGDTGVFDGGWRVVFAAPAPGALALLGLAGFAGTRRRRG